MTFKEDCPDLRNSKVIDIIRELQDYGINVQVNDPLADPAEALHEYGIKLIPREQLQPAAAVVLAVAHRKYHAFTVEQLKGLMGENPVLTDVKCIFDRQAVADAGIRLWRL